MTKEKKSMIFVIISMFIWGSVGIFRRYIPISSALLASIRGFIGTFVLFSFVKVSGHKLKFDMGIKKIFLLILTGALMGFNWILLFEAYNYTTVSTATLCYYMQPVFVILMAPVLFKEKLTSRKAFCALCAIIGMTLVSGIWTERMTGIDDFRGIIYGLGAALLYALVVIINKKLTGLDAFEKTMIQVISAAISVIPYILLTENVTSVTVNSAAVVLIIVLGAVHTGIAYVMYFGSIDHLKAQTVAIFSYIDPVTALALSTVILHEKMTFGGLIGAVLILGAAIMIER